MNQSLAPDLLERCANDARGPVALHLRQDLLPVEGKGAVFFPPTFASAEKYNIDELADGTLVALVDSVGSQANRMEPLFLQGELRALVPQIDIVYGDAAKGNDGVVSLLEAGHRLGDAVVRCTELADEAQAAFRALDKGDAEPMAKLAPTSLVFGAWDSRDTGVKVPRIVQSVVRAWDVSRLTRSATYNPALVYQKLGLVEDEDKLKKDPKKQKGLSKRGFLHAPAPGDHGGVIANGPIRRDVTVNLVALRRLDGKRGDEIRRYLLGLTLVASIEPLDPFFRQGCMLVPDTEQPAVWTLVRRDGQREPLAIDTEAIHRWAREMANAFGVASARTIKFDKKLAKQDIDKAKQKKK